MHRPRHARELEHRILHSYAASDGHSELRISELSWDDAGWPISAGP